jgi:hypothetical protein
MNINADQATTIYNLILSIIAVSTVITTVGFFIINAVVAKSIAKKLKGYVPLELYKELKEDLKGCVPLFAWENLHATIIEIKEDIKELRKLIINNIGAK